MKIPAKYTHLYRPVIDSFAKLIQQKELVNAEIQDTTIRNRVNSVLNMKYGKYNKQHILSSFGYPINKCGSGTCNILTRDGTEYVIMVKTRITSNTGTRKKEREQVIDICKKYYIRNIIFLEAKHDLIYQNTITKYDN